MEKLALLMKGCSTTKSKILFGTNIFEKVTSTINILLEYQSFRATSYIKSLEKVEIENREMKW